LDVKEASVAKEAIPFEISNAQARQTVDQTKEQILRAVDGYFDFLKQTISSYPSGGTELGERLKGYAEKNIAATREFIRRLSQAKDFQVALQIQSEFMQAQMQAFGEQVKSFGEASARAATGAVEAPFKSSFDKARPRKKER
jgi:hypothetical protein